MTRTCQNCASNGGYMFCAAGSPCFPCVDGDCSHWSQRDVTATVTGIMPDGSVQNVTPEQLYVAYQRKAEGWQVKLARYYTVLILLLSLVTIASGVVHVSCTILCEKEEITNK